MAPVSRTAVFAKIHKTLKKSYKPVAPPAARTVLEHLLFACVLEDARYEPAEEAFAALRHTFYDWNEIRVTSISELAEVMAVLPDPRAAANRVKRVLHGVFEELYCFDLEDRRKKNLGPTVKWLEKMDGTSRFVVAYVIQAGLGGHSIPLDTGTMAVLGVLGLVTEKEAAAGVVPGMERAVAKNKGVEFGSLLHQLGVDYLANPFSPQVREILLAIDPESATRFPQRRQPRPEPPSAAEAVAAPAAAPRKKKAEAAAPAKPLAAEAKPAESEPAASKPAEGKKAAGPASKKAAEAAQAPPPPAEKPRDKPPKAEKAETAERSLKSVKPDSAGKPEKRPAASKTSSSSDSLGKRKPR